MHIPGLLEEEKEKRDGEEEREEEEEITTPWNLGLLPCMLFLCFLDLHQQESPLQRLRSSLYSRYVLCYTVFI